MPKRRSISQWHGQLQDRQTYLSEFMVAAVDQPRDLVSRAITFLIIQSRGCNSWDALHTSGNRQITWVNKIPMGNITIRYNTFSTDTPIHSNKLKPGCLIDLLDLILYAQPGKFTQTVSESKSFSVFPTLTSGSLLAATDGCPLSTGWRCHGSRGRVPR
jgi:hypothetical protein